MPCSYEIEKTLETAKVLTASFNTDGIPVNKVRRLSMIAVLTDTAPAAHDFEDADVSVANNTITEADHGFVTGTKISALTTTGVLPAGLALATAYWVIKVDDDTYKLASSLANALAGTAVDITAAAGGGTHTATPAAFSGTLVIQASNDDVNWVQVATPTSLSGAGPFLLQDQNVAYKYMRAAYVATVGYGTVTLQVFGKAA